MTDGILRAKIERRSGFAAVAPLWLSRQVATPPYLIIENLHLLDIHFRGRAVSLADDVDALEWCVGRYALKIVVNHISGVVNRNVLDTRIILRLQGEEVSGVDVDTIFTEQRAFWRPLVESAAFDIAACIGGVDIAGKWIDIYTVRHAYAHEVGKYRAGEIFGDAISALCFHYHSRVDGDVVEVIFAG